MEGDEELTQTTSAETRRDCGMRNVAPSGVGSGGGGGGVNQVAGGSGRKTGARSSALFIPGAMREKKMTRMELAQSEGPLPPVNSRVSHSSPPLAAHLFRACRSRKGGDERLVNHRACDLATLRETTGSGILASGNWKLSRERNNECLALWPLMESKHRREMLRVMSTERTQRVEMRI